MILLSFDTSSKFLSAALYDGPKKLAVHESEVAMSHAEALAPVLAKLLKKAGVKPARIGCVAVGIGPGSFTGLRIAVTTAKVLSYTLKTKLVGISSLEAMARTAGSDGEYAALVDAKKSQVYAAVYQRKNKRWKTLRKPGLFLREDVLKSLKKETQVLEQTVPDACAIAEAALERIREGKFDDPLTLEPLYIHPKDCNVAKNSKK